MIIFTHLIQQVNMDLFDKIKKNRGPLGKHAKDAHGYFTFPKLEGEISNKMTFRGKEVLVWSINNYIGLSNQEEVRQTDKQAAEDWGLGYPMGSRTCLVILIFTKNENNLSSFMKKEYYIA